MRRIIAAASVVLVAGCAAGPSAGGGGSNGDAAAGQKLPVGGSPLRPALYFGEEVCDSTMEANGVVTPQTRRSPKHLVISENGWPSEDDEWYVGFETHEQIGDLRATTTITSILVEGMTVLVTWDVEIRVQAADGRWVAFVGDGSDVWRQQPAGDITVHRDLLLLAYEAGLGGARLELSCEITFSTEASEEPGNEDSAPINEPDAPAPAPEPEPVPEPDPAPEPEPEPDPDPAPEPEPEPPNCDDGALLARPVDAIIVLGDLSVFITYSDEFIAAAWDAGDCITVSEGPFLGTTLTNEQTSQSIDADYIGVGLMLTITGFADTGWSREVTLSDGLTWSISSLDEPKTGSWQVGDQVVLYDQWAQAHIVHLNTGREVTLFNF